MSSSGMTRANETFMVLALASTVYAALYFAPSIFALEKDSQAHLDLVPIIPFWVVVSIGCYLLGRLGWGVMNFNDTKEAYVELMGDSKNGIEGARGMLKARGVGTD